MTPDLKKYMDKLLTIKVNGDRRVSGILRGYDQFMNLVLDDAANVGFDDVVDLMRLPVPTTLVIGEGGVLQEVRTGREDAGAGTEGD